MGDAAESGDPGGYGEPEDPGGYGEPEDPRGHGEAGDPALLAWALASFHAALLVVAPVAAVHAIDPRALGDLLAGLHTGVGLLLYAVLWAATWATNRRWVAESDVGDARGTVRAGAKWGAVTGVIVLAAVVALLFVRTNPLFAGFVAAFGGVVSPVVGGTVGAALAALDAGLYRAAGALAE